LDKTGGGSTGPTLGQGRGKDQCNDQRTQTEEKYHTNPRTCQGNARDEEYAGITYHCTNEQTRVLSSNRTTAGTGRRSTRTGRRS
jgi:hypothetical protein